VSVDSFHLQAPTSFSSNQIGKNSSMTRIITRYSILLFFISLSTRSNAQARIQCTIDKANLDTLIEGEIITTNFAFQNIGTDNLRLTTVHSSCGCTIPAWKQQAIAPGNWDTIQASYHSVGHVGIINKRVYVESNGGNIELKLGFNFLTYITLIYPLI
jgi:hypothetical protein